MSCSLHDVIRLEAAGIPTAAVGTEPFLDEALEVAAMLGLPAYRMILVPHPVQLLSDDALDALADSAYPSIRSRLLASAA